jgi:cytochrome c553
MRQGRGIVESLAVDKAIRISHLQEAETEWPGSRKPRNEENMKKTTSAIIATLALCAWTTSAADVAALFEKSCVKCHGADGKGDTKMGKKVNVKDLTDAKVQSSFTDEEAFKTIKEGKKDQEGKIQMKAVEGASDEEIKALVAHVRTLKK